MDQPEDLPEVQPVPEVPERRTNPLLTGVVGANLGLAGLYLLLGAALAVVGVIVSGQVNSINDPMPASAWFLNIPLPLGLGGIGAYFKGAGMMMGLYVCMLGGLVALGSIPFFLAANGLLKREPWGRWWTLCLGGFVLLFALLGLANILFQDPRVPPEASLTVNQTWIMVILYVLHACYGAFVLGTLTVGKHLKVFAKPPRLLIIEKKTQVLSEE